MTIRKPLVFINGDISELPSGDTVTGASISNINALPYSEPVTVLHDPNGVQINDDEPYLVSCQGDVVVALGE